MRRGGEGERRTLREDAASSPQVHPGAVTAQRTGDERKSVRDLLLLVDALAPGRERVRGGGRAKKCAFFFASAVRGIQEVRHEDNHTKHREGNRMITLFAARKFTLYPNVWLEIL